MGIFFLRHISFCGSLPPILVTSGRAHGFLSELPMTSVSSRTWRCPRASVICSLVSYFPSISGASAGIPWLQRNWQLSESKLINKKKNDNASKNITLLLQSLCEHYLINHHNSSGEDKHCWLSYLSHILKNLFSPFLLLFDYAMKSG